MVCSLRMTWGPGGMLVLAVTLLSFSVHGGKGGGLWGSQLPRCLSAFSIPSFFSPPLFPSSSRSRS
jgi:hypothetical protein